MILRTLKSLRAERKQLQEEIRVLGISKRYLKTNCCDFCMNELLQCQRKSGEVKAPLYTIDLPAFKLRVCKEHMKELYYATKEIVEEIEGEEYGNQN